MNLSKWNSYIIEQDESEEPSTGQDAIQMTTNVPIEDFIIDYLGYEKIKDLGSGVFGYVYMIEDKETRNKYAIKIISGTEESSDHIDREVANYKFVLENRNTLGVTKKYFPIVYYSEKLNIQFAMTDFHRSSGSQPRINPTGVVIMELLEPLDPRVKKDLLATGGLETGARGRYDRQKVNFSVRDERLFKNHNVLYDIAKQSIMNSQLLQNIVPRDIGNIADSVARKAVNRYIKGEYKDIDGEAYDALQFIFMSDWRQYVSGRKGQVLFLLSLVELHRTLYPPGKDPLILFMNDSLLGNIYSQVLESFIKAYVRPIIPGTVHDHDSSASLEPQHSSALEQFPEARGFIEFIKAMKEAGFTGRDMHAGNFMVRPSDKELVIVDLGLFKMSGVAEIVDDGKTIPFFENNHG